MKHPIPTREAILTAAGRLYGRQGYAGASMRQIAEEAHVTKATLYHHFPDKAALFREALAHSLAELHTRIDEATEGIENPLARLRAWVHAHLRQFVDQRELVRQVYVILFLPEEAAEGMGDVLWKQRGRLHQILGECAADGHLDRTDVDDLCRDLMGALEYSGAISLLDPNAPRPGVELGDRILARFVPAAVPSSHRPPAHPLRDVGRRLAAWLLPFVATAGLWGASATAQTVEAVPGAGDPLELADCIEAALESNAGLRSVREGTAELAGRKKQAVAIGLPTLDATGTWSRSRDPSFALDQTFGGDTGSGDDSEPTTPLDSLLAGFDFIPAPEDIPAQTFWRTSLNAHWEVQPSLIYNAVGAASLGIRHQDLAILDVEHRTVEEVTKAYHAVVMAGEQLEALDADIAAKREFLDITRRRLYLGYSTPLDTLRARVAYANLLPQRRSAAQGLRDAGSNLNVLMGLSPQTPLTVSSETALETGALAAEEALAAVRRRPDLEQREVYARILRKNRGAIKAEHRPTLSADAAYGYVTGDFGDFLDKGHDFWNASVTLRVPLFDGLRTRGRVQEAEAQVRRAYLDYENAARLARLEVLSLLGELEAARTNHKAAQLNLDAAEDALQQMRLRYELGKADYLSVLDVQADRFLARSNLIMTRNEVLSLTASFKRALGFSPALSLSEILNQLEPSGS